MNGLSYDTSFTYLLNFNLENLEEVVDILKWLIVIGQHVATLAIVFEAASWT